MKFATKLNRVELRWNQQHEVGLDRVGKAIWPASNYAQNITIVTATINHHHHPNHHNNHHYHQHDQNHCHHHHHHHHHHCKCSRYVVDRDRVIFYYRLLTWIHMCFPHCHQLLSIVITVLIVIIHLLYKFHLFCHLSEFNIWFKEATQIMDDLNITIIV